MKENSTQISQSINDNSLLEKIKKLTETYPNHSYNDRNINEAVEHFLEIKSMLNINLESGYFDKISFKKRNQIQAYIQNINNQISNVNQTILNIETLYDYLVTVGLQLNLIGKRDFSKEHRNLLQLQEQLNDLISEFEAKKNSIIEFENDVNFVNEKKQEINSILELVEKEKEKIIELQKESKTSSETIENSKANVNQAEQDIETKRLNISTFSENIDDYKKSIEDLEKKAKLIIDKETKINELINQAEKALNLKSAEGISAAFSSEYAKNRNLKWWIVGAAIFILLAIALTVWIIGGWKIENPNSISSIIGRIVAVGISITGATFCAKQYTKQSNISEDYAYKAVLSKSIIAFTEEIKKRDDQKVAEYLEKVLNEIHKDPLRKRENSEEDTNGFLKETVGKIIDKIPGTN